MRAADQMMFLDCPAYLDGQRTVRCGLPAEVRCRFTVRSTDGPLESAMIRCPVGHWFTGPIESFTWETKNNHHPGATGAGSSARHDKPRGTHEGRPSRADPPPRIPPPNRSGKSAARTALLATTWAGPLSCGSPRCARAAAAPHPTWWRPAARNERHPRTTAPSQAPTPEPRRCRPCGPGEGPGHRWNARPEGSPP